MSVLKSLEEWRRRAAAVAGMGWGDLGLCQMLTEHSSQGSALPLCPDLGKVPLQGLQDKQNQQPVCFH